MANTTRQVERWKPGDAITSVRLNEMADAINFLLKTSGYIFNRVALANYHANESSGTTFDYPGIIQEVVVGDSTVPPHINAGRLVIPFYQGGAGLTGVSYDATSSSPYIENNELFLNYASSAPGSNYPGVIAGIEQYDPSGPSAPAAPGIFNGVITIPAGVTGALYDSEASAPEIKDGTLHLPFANTEASEGSIRPGAVSAVETYDPSDPSAPTSPGIFNGVITIPSAASAPSGVTDVYYDKNATSPYVSSGSLYLNVADSLQGTYPGSVLGVETYDPSHPSAPAGPCIDMGVIKVPFVDASGGGDPTPAGVTSIRYGTTGSTTPAPGVDGWVQTLYFWALNEGSATIHQFGLRQLMRVNGSVLEVVQQITNDGVTWTEGSA